MRLTGIIALCCLSTALFFSCKDDDDDNEKKVDKIIVSIELATDKARYAPGDEVVFTLEQTPPVGSIARYLYLGTIVAEEPVAGKSWRWTPPATDFRGYLVEVSAVADGEEKTFASTAVDVSSDWTKFPRYGFLSTYNAMPASEIESVIENLNRHHINGLQFYDWLLDHHKPLPGTVAAPLSSWTDLIGRQNTKQTSDAYLVAAKNRNMARMWYDLCYGALNNAAADGVEESWYLFKNTTHTSKDSHALSAPFRSSIYLVDPANDDWLNYFSRQVSDVYAVYDFDGFHIDQLGNRGTLYDYSGKQVNLPEGFAKFIRRMHTDFPEKKHAFNAVSGYGQEAIANAGISFIYSEIWNDTPNYADLKTIVDRYKGYNSSQNIVLAAYMNYNKSSAKGTFNTPGVVMTDALIFALGASHIELGEHILGNEYFPNDNLQPDKSLSAALIRYYDFLVAYQNLLRDGGEFNSLPVSSGNIGTPVVSWPPEIGKITALTKKAGNSQVIHLFNFLNAAHLKWCDTDGTQPEPRLQKALSVQIVTSTPVKKVWAATPDSEGKMYEELTFSQSANTLTVTVPALKYWTMLVLE